MKSIKDYASEILNDLRILQGFLMADKEKDAVFHLGMLMATVYQTIKAEEAKEPPSDDKSGGSSTGGKVSSNTPSNVGQ